MSNGSVKNDRFPMLPLAEIARPMFSEALYLSDPDGHSIEIYRDRPRSTWYDAQGKLRGASEPLDLRGILSELDGDVVVLAVPYSAAAPVVQQYGDQLAGKIMAKCSQIVPQNHALERFLK